MILSICIPSLPEPKSQEHFKNLISILGPQLTNEVEIVQDTRDRRTPTGTKRNAMYANASGKYVCSIDCDDWISPDYVTEVLEAAKSDPDVITFQGWMTENGRNHVNWTIKLGEKYEARNLNGVVHYFRFPNHLVAMKKSKIESVKFPDVWQGEDYRWAKEIHDRGLLKSEVHINKQLYHYKYVSNK
jgi:glycosyltransferase involved in cell wall biosynthesis